MAGPGVAPALGLGAGVAACVGGCVAGAAVGGAFGCVAGLHVALVPVPSEPPPEHVPYVMDEVVQTAPSGTLPKLEGCLVPPLEQATQHHNMHVMRQDLEITKT